MLWFIGGVLVGAIASGFLLRGAIINANQQHQEALRYLTDSIAWYDKAIALVEENNLSST